MSRRTALWAGLLMAAAGATEAQQTTAQRDSASAPQGFFFSLGGGAGSATSCTCCSCAGSPQTGLAGSLRIGTSVSRQVVLAVGTSGWWQPGETEAAGSALMGWLGGLAVLYPTSGPLWVQLGGGLTRGAVADETADYTSTGVGAILGMGYDFRAGTSLILAPYVNVLASQGTLRAGTAVVDDRYTPTAVQFGLAITFP
jgi:hypothetical protein